MHLTLTPVQGLPGQTEMTIHVAGDVLTLDGVALDLSAVPEGAEVWHDSAPALLGPVRRVGEVLHVTLVARLGDDACATQGGPWVIPDAQGDVAIPASRQSLGAED
jgi:hypothetical protein